MALRRRLTNALRELEAAVEFDYVVVNDDLDRAYRAVEAILRAEWSRVERIRDLSRHTTRLQGELQGLIGDR